MLVRKQSGSNTVRSPTGEALVEKLRDQLPKE